MRLRVREYVCAPAHPSGLQALKTMEKLFVVDCSLVIWRVPVGATCVMTIYYILCIITPTPATHRYQLDGYLNGGTAPWMQDDAQRKATDFYGNAALERARMQGDEPWLLEGQGGSMLPSGSAITMTHLKTPIEITPDPEWYKRGTIAYDALKRSDPKAV